VIVGTVVMLGGVALVVIRKSQTLSDVVTGLFSRGQDPAPITFGPGLITALGVVLAVAGLIGLILGLTA
jgi:hypothetical protein